MIVRAPGVDLACFVEGAGPTVLLVHGFPDCARTFRLQIPALVARGFRAVWFAQRGYAPSSLARDGRYDVGALADDLLAVADHFSPSQKVALVGHDWGALAAYAASGRAPDRFSHLCTLAVPHPRATGARWLHPLQLRRSWYMLFFQLRGVAERRVARDDFRFVDELWRAWSPGFTPPPGELSAVKQSFAAPERLAAVLGYYRALFSPQTARARRDLLRRTKIPALYLHGADDGCARLALCKDLDRAYASSFSFHAIPRAGHFLHQECPDEVNALLLDFLTRR